MIPIAEKFEKADQFLAAIVINRALIDSILERALSKYYHHAMRYLKRLDKLSLKVTDWGTIIQQESYLGDLARKHKLKRTFWAKAKRSPDELSRKNTP